jgi:serine/threonine-protein kinase
MDTQTTLLGPEAPPGRSGVSGLPRDLLDQVRGRVRLLMLLLFVAFALEPVVVGISLLVATLHGDPIPPMFYAHRGFVLADAAVAVASAGLWWVARQDSVSPTRLHTLGLVYQVVICFEIAFTTMWAWALMRGGIPPLTWVPTVIVLFPLIMPGPPRRMLLAAVLAGAMSPLALLLLDRWGKVSPLPDDYFQAVLGPVFGIGFAYMGARVVYGLGRQVAVARELGSYQLEEPLGRGGMGEVWRARHRMLARPAAIKLIRPSPEGVGASEEARRRFEREAQVIASLRSPHTVELFDFGIAEGGAFYYVMELLEGLDTEALVRRFGPVSAGRAIYMLRQVCHSLAEAQSCGLVHRDIKPANIFLCRYGEDHDFVKVLDFGLVKYDQDESILDTIKSAELTTGTPAYMAPEMASGADPVDRRADLYALGCVGYWLLTGQMVFEAETPLKMLIQHIQALPVPPSIRTGRSVPLDLERVIMRCLEKDPTRRPQTADELVAELDQVVLAYAWDQARARAWWEEYVLPPAPTGAAMPREALAVG